MNNMQFEIKHVTPLKLVPKKLCIHLTKHVQDLHEENYKTLIKEIKELNEQRDNPCSWIG